MFPLLVKRRRILKWSYLQAFLTEKHSIVGLYFTGILHILPRTFEDAVYLSSSVGVDVKEALCQRICFGVFLPASHLLGELFCLEH